MEGGSTSANNAPITIEEKTLIFEKNKFRIELLKWFIGSVVLVIMTVIIDKGFKERSAGVQEMQAFDKYVDIILKANNIEERYTLSEYFATVTPTERLRERWIAYKTLIDDGYHKYIKLKTEEAELTNKNNTILKGDSSIASGNNLIAIRTKLKPFENKLVNNGDYNSAQTWEEQGFLYLLNKNVEAAITAFRNSDNAYNGFHQVYEITKYLSDNKAQLINSNSIFWDTVYRKILSDYSWKMPIELRNKFVSSTKH